MVLVTQSHNVTNFNAGVMPNLGNPIIRGRSLWVWGIWWSKFIKVNLDAFCYDTDPCADPEQTVFGIPKVVLIVVIVGSVICYCGCIAIFIAIAFMKSKKHSKHHGETAELLLN